MTPPASSRSAHRWILRFALRPTDRMEAERLERDCGCAGKAGCGSRYCPRPSP